MMLSSARLNARVFGLVRTTPLKSLIRTLRAFCAQNVCGKSRVAEQPFQAARIARHIEAVQSLLRGIPRTSTPKQRRIKRIYVQSSALVFLPDLRNLAYSVAVTAAISDKLFSTLETTVICLSIRNSASWDFLVPHAVRVGGVQAKVINNPVDIFKLGAGICISSKRTAAEGPLRHVPNPPLLKNKPRRSLILLNLVPERDSLSNIATNAKWPACLAFLLRSFLLRPLLPGR